MFLHGAFGAGRNWATIARRLVHTRPEWEAILVDLRLHGDSKGFLPPHTIDAAAADIDALARALGEPIAAVVGHSLGGKVALRYAPRQPQDLRQLWIVDATPAAGPPSGSAWQMLHAVRSMPAEFATRQEAAAGLVRFGFTPGVANWMTMNLTRTSGRYQWRLDFAALEELLRDFFRANLWSTVAHLPPGIALHVIKAYNSDTLDDDALSRLRSLAAKHSLFVHTVEGGHWIHADNPSTVVTLLAHHLP